MIRTIYVEDGVRAHSRTVRILGRFPRATVIPCQRYGEVFNPRAQNFRLQKRRPALIVAEKFGNLVLEAPRDYGIGGRRNFYFSHMLNCIYDCRYCFLQGMYRSAHYVLFVNYDDFQDAILETVEATPANELTYFFSGYDCDSLALESVTGFADAFLPFFRQHPRAVLELRTKSTQIRALLGSEPMDNCVVAFSFTPEPAASILEREVPPVAQRLTAMQSLAEHGWPLGLRFDPLLYHQGYQRNYAALFRSVFRTVPIGSIHSVSIGPLRFPREMFANIENLYPEEELFAASLESRDGMVTYPIEIENEMNEFCRRELGKYLPADIFFSCSPETQ